MCERKEIEIEIEIEREREKDFIHTWLCFNEN